MAEPRNKHADNCNLWLYSDPKKKCNCKGKKK